MDANLDIAAPGPLADRVGDAAFVRGPATRWVVALGFGVVALAIVLRGAINFADALPGGMDAAYYPMQSWWLLTHGRLAYNDLPLIFVLGAALAKVLMQFGMDIDAATLLASRVIDSVIAPFSAAALLAMGWRWLPRAKRTRAAACALTAAACVAALSLPTMRMVGDFQKNSLGLVWFVCAIWAARAAFTRGGAWRWFALAVAVGLAALTHVAVVGATVLAVGLAMIVFFAGQHDWTIARVLRVSVVTAGIVALLLGGIYLASPRRAVALALAPIKLFTNDGRGGPGGGPGGGPNSMPRNMQGGAPGRDAGDAAKAEFDRRMAIRNERRESAVESPSRQLDERDPPLLADPTTDTSPDDAPDDRPPPPRDDERRAGPPGGFGPGARGQGGRGPGGPPGMGGLRLEGLITWFAYPVALLAAFRLWRERHAVSSADLSIVVGLIALTLLLACPFLSFEYAHRLSLMAPAPVALLLVFLVVRRATRGAAHWPAAIVAVIALAPTAAAFGVLPSPGPDARRSIAGHAILSAADAAEIITLRSQIEDPRRTLVVAPHGLEWWAGYLLKTAVAEGRPPEDAYVRYDRVLYLEQIGSQHGPRDMDPSRPGPWAPGVMGSGTDGAFRDIDLLFEGSHVRLYEYPVPGEDTLE